MFREGNVSFQIWKLNGCKKKQTKAAFITCSMWGKTCWCDAQVLVFVLQVSCHCLRQSVHHQQDSGSNAAHRSFYWGKSDLNDIHSCFSQYNSSHCTDRLSAVYLSQATVASYQASKNTNTYATGADSTSVFIYIDLDVPNAVQLLLLTVRSSAGVDSTNRECFNLWCRLTVFFILCRICLRWQQTKNRKWGRMCAEL